MNLCKRATMMVNVDDPSQICCNLWWINHLRAAPGGDKPVSIQGHHLPEKTVFSFIFVLF